MKSPIAPTKFICAQQDSARRGAELLAPSISHNPAREEVLPKRTASLPVKVLPKPMPKPETPSDLMKAELLKLVPPPKVISAKKIKGLVRPVEEEQIPPYMDILKMLNNLK